MSSKPVWIGLCIGYIVILWLTSMAGPLWALWLWSLVAFPLFVITLWKRNQRTRGDAAIAIIWLVLAVGVPVVVRRLESRGANFPAIVEPLLTIIVITWPLIVARFVLRSTRRLDA